MRWLVVSGFLLLRIGRVVFCSLATIHRVFLCGYSLVLLLVIMCLDCLSPYILDFTLYTFHSRAYLYGYSYSPKYIYSVPV